MSLKAVIRRLLSALAVLWIVASASFFLMRAAPGGPFDADRPLSPQVRANIDARYGLDQPLWRQYLRQMEGVARLDFGPSMKYPDRTVNEILKQGLPVSTVLGMQALLVALLVGLPVGFYAGWVRGRWQDPVLMGGAMVGVSIPNFVLGPLLLYAFALQLGWFDSANWAGPSAGLWAHVRSSALPSLSLGLYYAAYVARLARGGMLEVSSQDYVRTARAKGLSEPVIITQITRGAITPVVSFLGPAAAGLLSGSVVIEKIFNLPGLGTHFVQSAFNRDYPLVMGTIVLYSALLVLLNLVVDLAYHWLDPRVRRG